MRPRPGTAAMLDVSVSPLFARDGLFEGAICLLTDLSAVHELEAQLRLKEGLARLGELAAGIAHEFRNGLATIHGYARLMPLDQLPGELHPHIRGIQQETTALGGVVTRFLEFARPAPLSVAPVAMRDLLVLALREVEPALNEAGGTVEIEGHAPPLDGDAVLLQRALVNVLRNALDACARVPVKPRLRAVFEVTEAPHGLTMRLLDNGSGFTRESEARAFEPFFTTRADGTGLGLALVQKFVLLHGGRVSVENRTAAGAAVSIWLPLHQI
jgi:signal transduction histidine kinase